MATIERTFEPGPQTGFHGSDIYEYVVSASGSLATAIDLERPYAGVAVSCNGVTGNMGSLALKARVARDADGTLNPLWKLDGEGLWISGTLPASGGFDFLLTHAFYAQRLQLEFTGTLTAGGTLYVSGYEPGIT